jgi:hypothetical protein
MSKKTKLRLEDLKVQSFVTSLSREESQKIKAGDDYDDAIDQRKQQAQIPADSRIAVSLFLWVCGCIAL